MGCGRVWTSLRIDLLLPLIAIVVSCGADDVGWNTFDGNFNVLCDQDAIRIVHDVAAAATICHAGSTVPCLIKGGANDWPAMTKWTRAFLDEHHGHVRVKYGTSSSIVSNSGDGENNGETLNRFLSLMREERCRTPRSARGVGRVDSDDETTEACEGLYMFDRVEFLKHAPTLFQDFHEPIYPNSDDVFHYFLLSSNSSGVSLHYHTEGWNALIFGLKRWVLYPPSQRPPHYPTYNGHINWYRKVMNEISSDLPAPILCDQERGDILFIPEGWYHATVSYGESVAVAAQLKTAHEEPLKTMLAAKKITPTTGAKEAQMAIESLLKAASSMPSWSAEIHNDAGMIADRTLHDYDQAAKLFLMAVDLNPEFAEAHFNAGRMLKRRKNFPEAIHHYQKAIDLDPRNADHHHNIANALMKIGRIDDAVESYTVASDLDSENPNVFRSLGNALVELGRRAHTSTKSHSSLLARGGAALEVALLLSPSDVSVLNDYGAFLAETGELKESLKYFRKALKIDPIGVPTYMNMISVFRMMGRADGALDLAKKALTVTSDKRFIHIMQDIANDM